MTVLYNYGTAFLLMVAMFGIATKGQEVMELGPCGEDGVFEIANNTANNNLVFYFGHSVGNGDLDWRLTTSRGQTVYHDYCPIRKRLNIMCAKYQTVFSLTTVSANWSVAFNMTLTVSTVENSYNLSGKYFDSGTSLFGNSTVLVRGRVFSPERPYSIRMNCTTDFVELAEVESCSVTYSTETSPWSFISRCDVTKTYSAMGRYSCRLLSKLAAAEPVPLGSAVAMTTRAIDGVYHVSGSCTMTSQFPAIDGNYTYFVEIIPGRKRYNLVFDGRSEVWKPTRPSHNCPANVDEGTDVTCSCVISDDGNPKATVMWQTGSSSLALVNISRADNGKVFTCQVVWDGNPLYTLQYPLPVRYKPTSPRLSHNCPAYVTEGSSLDCTCVTSDPGSPPAVLNWSTTPSEHLVLSNVQRNDEGLTMTCLMTWGGAVVTSVNYTLLVIPDAQAAFSRGLGVGLGVGVALLVTAVVVVVVLLWRRGWTLVLLCRHWTPDTTELRDVMKITQADTELSLPDDHRSGDPAQVYEKMDVTQIGLASTYQSLTVTPAEPKNTKRAKQNKKKAVSSRGHDNPAMAEEGGLMTQKQTGGAGGETHQNVTKSQRKPPKMNKSYTADSAIYGNA